MSRTDWKFLKTLPNGSPMNTSIGEGDKLEDALWKLQGQTTDVKDRTNKLELNVQGSALVDLTDADETLYLTEEQSACSTIIFFDNNNEAGHYVSLYDSPNNPTQLQYFNCNAETVTVRMGTNDDEMVLQPTSWSLIAYGYTSSFFIETSGRVYDNDYGDITVSNKGLTWSINDGVLDKSDVGLGNVDNTSDDNKPISTATQSALDNKADKSITVNGQALSSNVTITKSDVGLSNVDNTADTDKPISTATASALSGKENISNKGVANGYAPLDSNAKVSTTYLPDSVLGGLKFKGTWNANTNNITSSDGTINNTSIPSAASGNEGWYFIVGTSGSTSVNGITDWVIGDWVLSTGSTWVKIDNTDQVVSVNGLTGAVTLTTANISDATNYRYVTDAEKTKLSNLSGVNSGDQTITLTSDVTGSGTGSFATTIANNAVSNAKAADMDTQTIKGRNTAGTGDPEDLNVTTVTAMLNAMVGAGGSAGTKGLVPQPPANSQNNVLTGDATFKNVGSIIDNATTKTTPVDADTVALSDSAASAALKKLSWANIKATLKSYFDTLYLALPGANGIAVRTSATTSVNRTITGTSGLIDVTDGDGVSGNPTLAVNLNNGTNSWNSTYTTTARSYANIGPPMRLTGLDTGTYLVMCTVTIGHSASNVSCFMSLYAGSTGSPSQVANTQISCAPTQGGTSIEPAMTTHGIVTITGTDIIEPRFYSASGTLTIYRCIMTAVRIG